MTRSETPAAGPASRRIVVAGGGAGGLELAARLAGARIPGAEVLLIDRRPTHVWKPRLHEVAVGSIARDELVYREHAHRHGYGFLLGEIAAVDTDARRLTLAPLASRRTRAVLRPETTVPYDVLVLAVGSRTNDFGIPGVLEHAFRLDGPDEAADLQRALVEATQRPDPHTRVTIVGAGATGVELAAELHYAFDVLGRFGIGGTLATTLVDGAPRVMPMLDPAGSARIEAWLGAAGVELLLSARVAAVEAGAVRLADGRAIASDLTVWASGVTGADLLTAIPGLSLGRGRRIEIDDRLRCKGVEGVLALGDCAAAADGGALPPTAQVAHQQASYLGRALPEMLAGRTPPPFRFHPKGVLVDLGHEEAVGELGSRRLGVHGALPRLAFAALEQAHRTTLYGGGRAAALWAADRLGGLALPPLKLH